MQGCVIIQVSREERAVRLEGKNRFRGTKYSKILNVTIRERGREEGNPGRGCKLSGRFMSCSSLS